jgi:hypothetical protein
LDCSKIISVYKSFIRGTKMAQSYEKQLSVDQMEQGSNAPVDNALKPIDTVHGDEAAKIFAGYTGEQEWTEAEEKMLRRKIDWRLLPVLCMTYGIQYVDGHIRSQSGKVANSPSKVLR